MFKIYIYIYIYVFLFLNVMSRVRQTRAWLRHMMNVAACLSRVYDEEEPPDEGAFSRYVMSRSPPMSERV